MRQADHCSHPHPEEKVPGTVPNDPKTVSDPQRTLVWYILTKARFQVNWVAPNRGAKRASTNVSRGGRRSQKGNSIKRGCHENWQSTVRKSSVASLVHARFASRLAGSTAVGGWQGMELFPIFISQILRPSVSNAANLLSFVT